MITALLGACLLAAFPAGLRWLRVAQREHYLAGSVAVFASRWWTSGALNGVLLALMVAGLVGSWWSAWWAFLVPAAQLGPIGLSIRGRTSPLAWTARLRRVAIVAATLVAGVYSVGAALESGFIVALGVFLLPGLIDIALLVLAPIERMLGNRWVEQASARLQSSGAKVVAITGSYGKTTTKQYAAHLLAGTFRTVASPASFNNRMGLARAINEHLVPGTEVFVAEMGTYGAGEIEALTRWIPPDVAAMVAIGPVHLERFRTLERIVAAKSEILDRARVGVISVDHPLLADLALERKETMDVITVSGDGADARVTVEERIIRVDGVELGEASPDVFKVNLAVAVGIGLALGVEPGDMASRRAASTCRKLFASSCDVIASGFTFVTWSISWRTPFTKPRGPSHACTGVSRPTMTPATVG